MKEFIINVARGLGEYLIGFIIGFFFMWLMFHTEPVMYYFALLTLFFCLCIAHWIRDNKKEDANEKDYG